jgi:hypothetical protein
MRHRRFLLHLSRNGVFGLGLISVSLGIGMIGYRVFEHVGWEDAYLNAAMLLGGMGPVKTDLSPAGKVFAATYALYAGLVFIALVGILLSPVGHKVLHDFDARVKERRAEL